MLTCPNCQKPLRSGARFCGYCGTSLPLADKVSAPAAQNPAPFNWKPSGMTLLVIISFVILICSAGSIFLFFRSKGVHRVGIAATAAPVPAGPAVQVVETLPTQTPITQPASPVPLPDPIGFIYSYYNYLNNRDYASAWSSLSGDFIVKMGNKAGHPYDYTNDYAAYWDTVAGIDVLEASLESQDSRSAAVLLKLRWNMFSGASPVYNHRFYLIKHPSANSWLIDVTETWN